MTIRVPLDFSEAKEFAAIEGGVYDAVLEKIVWQEQSGNQKADQLRVAYTITDGEYKGEPISQWLSFSERALFRMKEFFDAFDVDMPDELEIDEEDGVLLDPDLSGTPVQIKVTKVKSFKDRTKWVNQVDGAPKVTSKPKASSRRSRDEDDEPEETGKRRGGRSIR